MNNQKKRVMTVTVNERGQIVIPEGIRKDMGIKNSDTLVIIERGGEMVIKKEEDVLVAIDGDEFWKAISRKSLKNMWSEEDEVWDEFARKDMNA